MSFKQPDIDLMYWQYCMGVLEVANQLENVSLSILNALANGRFDNLNKQHHLAPTFRVSFDQHLTHFSIKKLPV